MNVGSLFSGCGGLDLGLHQAGHHIVWACEPDLACRRVLERHWPHLPVYPDARELDPSTPQVDLLAGGFPCQDLSYAGKGAGLDGDRSGLWYAMAAAVRLLRPRYVLVENVPGLATRGQGRVLYDLAEAGYVGSWFRLRAADIGAPHGRERIFIVAADAERGIQRRAEPRTVPCSAGADQGAGDQRERVWADAGDDRPVAADADRTGQSREGGQPPRQAGGLQPARCAVADADRLARTTPLTRGSEQPHGQPGPLPGVDRRDRAAADAERQRRQRAEPQPCWNDGRDGYTTTTDADGTAGPKRDFGSDESEFAAPFGYDAERRDQIVAHADGRSGPRRRVAGRDHARPDTAAAADAAGGGWRRGSDRAGSDAEPRQTAKWEEGDAAAGDCDRVAWGAYGSAIRRWEHILGRAAPPPTDAMGRLEPVFVEWMLGFPDGWTEGEKRTQRLRMLGNAVQVQCATLIGQHLP